MDQTLPSEIQLSVVTPAREVAHEKVRGVTVPGKSGYLGILPGHAPLLSELQAGELTYERESSTEYLAVSRGFVEVLPERVIVLADTAIRGHDLDEAKASDALKRAEEARAKATDKLEIAAAQSEFAMMAAQLAAIRKLRPKH